VSLAGGVAWFNFQCRVPLCCLTALVVFRMCCVQERSDKIVTLRYLKELTIFIGWMPKSRFIGMGLGKGMIGRALVFDEFSVRLWFLVQLDIMLERVSILSGVGGSTENNVISMQDKFGTRRRVRDEIEFMKQMKSRGPRIEP